MYRGHKQWGTAMSEHVEKKEYGLFVLALLSFITGIIAGCGAYLFRALIALFHNLFFNRTLSLSYDANVHTAPSPWGVFIVLVPVVGAVCVVYLVKNYAPEAKGHGVPEVMDAIYYNKGIIRPTVAVVKSLASALSIGSGGSVGREGPIAQIGSAFGSTLGQLLRMNPWQCNVLIASGAGGGIAATFNTPLGGLLFAIEILLYEVSVRTLVPVFIATATATYIGQLFFGTYPAFRIPDLETPFFHLDKPVVLFAYVGLGIALGVVSTAYIRAVYGFEDLFENHLPGNDYFRHITGMLLVGLMFMMLQRYSGHYYIEGVGYAAIQDILSMTLHGAGFLLLLLAMKLVATALTIGSGGSGGIFSPSLFIGAAFGGAYGIMLNHFFPELGISPPAFALAGMAGLVGGATGAALTAIVMIQEMTLDYSVVIPVTITVAVCFGIRKLLCRESIYTMKLVRRGHFMPEALHSTIQNLIRAEEIMETRFTRIPATLTVKELAEMVRNEPEARWFLIMKAEKLIGLLSREAALESAVIQAAAGLVETLPSLSFIVVEKDVQFYSIIVRMRLANASVAIVVHGEGGASKNLVGIIGEEQVAKTISKGTESFPVFTGIT
ncbi:CIC family chloride channel protein [Geobacter argillaceus]|uniref:CIC family chloride channel protein n=2 Tax=Geobacter argillaceus TaxID=345631 RepID=A0A562VFH7_9BACT|nr:CIC family chloride channel protein [Geobacter argillaceus]